MKRAEAGIPEPLTGEAGLPPGLHANELNGAKVAVDHIRTQAALCPNQRLVVAGYSEGAWVLGDALADTELRPLYPRIDKVLLFGDPMFDSDSPAVHAAPGQGPPRQALGAAARALGPRQPSYVPAELEDRSQSYCWSGSGQVDPVCATFGGRPGQRASSPGDPVTPQEWAGAMRVCGSGIEIITQLADCGHLKYADGLSGSFHPRRFDITVSSTTAGWRDTGLHVTKGQTVTIKPVAGSWTVDRRMFDRVGIRGYPADTDHAVAPGCKIADSGAYGQLLAAVGTEGSDVADVAGVEFPAHEAAGGTYTADADGTLFVRINDQDRCLGDNVGLVTVTVTEEVVT
ncbi:cutinase family protein [Kitasatospora sp. NBC_00374]|uniref:cutinase family protein n=1 Tax=Kitasatospora sp. NBC_00374 TaxID=2975964 RepID=UPI0032458C17